MDRVTFELAPRDVRLRAIAVLAASLALQLVAIFAAPWFTARVGDETLSIQLLSVPDAPDLTATSSLPHTLALIALLLLGVRYLIKLGVVIVTTDLGRPLVRRGLFRSKLIVGWKSPAGAHVWTALLALLALYAAIDTPILKVLDTDVIVATDLGHSWGGGLFVLSFVVAQFGLYLIGRDPVLAAAQTWAEPAAIDGVPTQQPAARPAPKQRPMIKSPLPPPPTGLTGDPFRSPAPASGTLDDKIVRPSLPTSTPKVAAGGSADEPSLLR